MSNQSGALARFRVVFIFHRTLLSAGSVLKAQNLMSRSLALSMRPWADQPTDWSQSCDCLEGRTASCWMERNKTKRNYIVGGFYGQAWAARSANTSPRTQRRPVSMSLFRGGS